MNKIVCRFDSGTLNIILSLLNVIHPVIPKTTKAVARQCSTDSWLTIQTSNKLEQSQIFGDVDMLDFQIVGTCQTVNKDIKTFVNTCRSLPSEYCKIRQYTIILRGEQYAINRYYRYRLTGPHRYNFQSNLALEITEAAVC